MRVKNLTIPRQILALNISRQFTTARVYTGLFYSLLFTVKTLIFLRVTNIMTELTNFEIYEIFCNTSISIYRLTELTGKPLEEIITIVHVLTDKIG